MFSMGTVVFARYVCTKDVAALKRGRKERIVGKYGGLYLFFILVVDFIVFIFVQDKK